MSNASDASSKVPWPPILYGASLLIAGALTWMLPLPVLPTAAIHPVRLAGFVLLVAALALGAAAVAGFLRAGTAIPPTHPATVLVTSGLYRWSRNPMYLAFTAILVAVAMIAGSPWFLLAAAIAAAAVTKLAIEPEERYLARRFGGQYAAYKEAVRRWL